MKKIWVIPDIHGCSRTLQALIGEQIRPKRTDALYFLGDYIDRGPDSKGVIDYLIHLQEDEYDVHFLRGNHEDYLLGLYEGRVPSKKILGLTVGNKLKKEWFRFGGKETMKSFQAHDVRDIPQKYLDWLKDTRLYFKLEEYLLVHAGFNFEIDDPFTDEHAMMWIKDFKVLPKKIGHKRIVHGHVPVSLEFIDLVSKSENFDFIDLDNGIYMAGKEGFGNLVAMELNSKELVIQPNIDMQ